MTNRMTARGRKDHFAVDPYGSSFRLRFGTSRHGRTKCYAFVCKKRERKLLMHGRLAIENARELNHTLTTLIRKQTRHPA